MFNADCVDEGARALRPDGTTNDASWAGGELWKWPPASLNFYHPGPSPFKTSPDDFTTVRNETIRTQGVARVRGDRVPTRGRRV